METTLLNSVGPNQQCNSDQTSAQLEAVYQRNLVALTCTQPDLARMIESAPIACEITYVTGRDGSATYQLTDENGRRTWLGGSSMPSVSAVELICRLGADDGNVILPGIFTGREPLAAANLLPACRAIFVVEKSLLHLKLAMRLHDYTALFSSGRLVILHGEIAGSLVDFFRRYPGYLMPARLLTIGSGANAELAELQKEIESAGGRIHEMQGERAQAEAALLARRDLNKLPENPTILITGTDATPASFERAERLRRAARALGWKTESCMPDAPGKCHLVARMQAAARCKPDVLIFINSEPGAMRALLPGALPTASIYSPEFARFDLPAPVENHFFAVTGEAFASPAKEHRDDVFRWEPGAEAMSIPEISNGRGDSPEASDAAIFLDLPSENPGDYGIALPSHVDLWRALFDEARTRIRGRQALDMEDILAKAARVTQVGLLDENLRKNFARLAEHVIRPRVLAEEVIDLFRNKKLRLHVWGRNWPESDGTFQVRGPLHAAKHFHRAAVDSRCVLFPYFSEAQLQKALDLMSAGVIVVCRGPRRAFSNMYPTLAEIEPYFHFYNWREMLEQVLCSIFSSVDQIRKRAAAAREMILAGHTEACRIRAFLSWMRTRGNAVDKDGFVQEM